jgi:3-(3-hydroxy-phenyl)propionate hydroxylase
MPVNNPPLAHEVIVAGGGPTGLMLAGELALGGVDVGIIEQRMNQDIEGSRANGLHPRSIELLDQRGIAERFVSQGKKLVYRLNIRSRHSIRPR